MSMRTGNRHWQGLLATIIATVCVLSSAATGHTAPTEILYTGGADPCALDIYTADMATGTISGGTLLHSDPDLDHQIRWSDDGSQIVFVQGTGCSGSYAVWVADANGTNPQQVSTTGSYTSTRFFSSTKIWCSKEVSGNIYEVYEIDLVTSTETQLSNFGQLLESFDFDDARTRIVYELRPAGNNSASEVWVASIDPAGNIDWAGATQITSNGVWDGKPGISRDGSMVAFSRDGTTENLYIAPADGSGIPQRVTTGPSGSHFLWPIWSPNGAQILCTFVYGGQADLYLANTDGSPGINLTNTPAYYEFSWDWQGSANGLCSSLNFDGSAGYNYVRAGKWISGIHDEWTMEAWCRRDGPLNEASGHIIVHRAHQHDKGINIRANGEIQFYENQGSTASTWISSPVSMGEWHHAAMVSTGGYMLYYIDGVLMNSAPKTYSGSDWDSGYTGSFIGGWPDGIRRFAFNGAIDEVRIWDYGRTQTEIQTAMYQTLAGTEAGLVAYYDFNEGSGQIAHDKSSHGVDGQLGNSPGTDANDPNWLLGTDPTCTETPPDEPLYQVRETYTGSGVWRIYHRDSPEPYIIKGVVKNSLEWKKQGHWGPNWGNTFSNSDFITMATVWKATTVRLPLNQVFWLGPDGAAYKALVGRAVASANDAGLNVILDLHWTAGGTLDESAMGLYRLPDTYSIQFWREVACEFKENERVFFELFNEPFCNDWQAWRYGACLLPGDYYHEGNEHDKRTDRGFTAVGMQQLITEIRATGARNLILVGGLDWARDLRKIETEPLTGDNIVYTVHTYKAAGENTLRVALEPQWDKLFGYVAQKYPVVATEYGQYDCCNEYVSAFLEYAVHRDIGTTGWAWYWQNPSCTPPEPPYDPCEHPSLIRDASGNPSAMGLATFAYLTGTELKKRCDCNEYSTEDDCDFCDEIVVALHCPATLRIVDPAGHVIDPIVNEIKEARYDEIEIAPGDTATFVRIGSPLKGIYSIEVNAKPDAVPADSFTLVIVRKKEDTLLQIENGFVGNIPNSGYIVSTLDTGSVAGVAISGSQELLGVPVDLYDDLGNWLLSDVTDTNGAYGFYGLPNGAYTVSIATPLGYQAMYESQEIIVQGLPLTVDFDLTALAIVPNQRSRGYWANRLRKALKGHPKEYTTDDFSRFATLIGRHFNNNGLNSVDVYQVNQPATQRDSLEALYSLLRGGMKCGDHTNKHKNKARSQLTALLLNVASGKLSQSEVISEDGATASQAITYVHDLIISDSLCLEYDDDEYEPHHGNHDDDDSGPSQKACLELAKEIAGEINEGDLLPAGMIPHDIVNIAYRPAVNTSNTVPREFGLLQNYPNPFNAGTTISYSLDVDGHVHLEVFDVLGRHVATLVNDYRAAGLHEVRWDGNSSSGREASSGLYFYRLTVDDRVESRKMVLLK